MKTGILGPRTGLRVAHRRFPDTSSEFLFTQSQLAVPTRTRNHSSVLSDCPFVVRRGTLPAQCLLHLGPVWKALVFVALGIIIVVVVPDRLASFSGPSDGRVEVTVGPALSQGAVGVGR